MKTKLSKTLRPLFLLVYIPLFILLDLVKKPINVSAIETTLTTSFNSDTLVTSATYQKYENDDWILSVGGNNNGIGASSLHSSKLALGTYSYLIGFDQTFSSSTQYVSSLIGKKVMNDISKIRISRGASNYNYSGVKVYLVRSTNLTSDYELVTTIDEITTSATDYMFEANTEPSYYGLVFYNPAGVFLLGNVTIDFYSQSKPLTFSKITSPKQLYFGATYTLVSEQHNQVISFDEINDMFVSVPISITNSQIEDNENILKFKLGIGELIDTYSFQIVNGSSEEMFLTSVFENELTLALESTVNESFGIVFAEGYATIMNNDMKTLAIDMDNNRFVFASGSSELSLYLINAPIDYVEEANMFSDVVLVKGENAQGKCDELYIFLNNVYSRLSEVAREYFQNSINVSDIKARERINYLSSLSVSNYSRNEFRMTHENPSFLITVLTFGILSISSYLYLNRKHCSTT